MEMHFLIWWIFVRCSEAIYRIMKSDQRDPKIHRCALEPFTGSNAAVGPFLKRLQTRTVRGHSLGANVASTNSPPRFPEPLPAAPSVTPFRSRHEQAR
jgi:hypothetical protein